jgi:hypothetical protein
MRLLFTLLRIYQIQIADNSLSLINYFIFLQLFVHSSIETLHDHITKDALPKEYGGNLDSISSYYSKFQCIIPEQKTKVFI